MNILINGINREFDAKSMMNADLVNTLNVAVEPIAIACNGRIVPRSWLPEVTLNEGDKLEIVGAIGKG